MRFLEFGELRYLVDAGVVYCAASDVQEGQFGEAREIVGARRREPRVVEIQPGKAIGERKNCDDSRVSRLRLVQVELR